MFSSNVFFFYFLFSILVHTAVIPNLFMLQNGISCISWYLQISAEHFNMH